MTDLLRRPARAPRRIAALLLPLALVACEGDGPTGPDLDAIAALEPATFRARVTGGEGLDVHGVASFTSHLADDPERSGFGMRLITPMDAIGTEGVIEILWTAGRPAVGSYAITPQAGESTFAGRARNLGPGTVVTMPLFEARSGRVFVTHSSCERVEGEFEMRGRGWVGNYEQQVTVKLSGQFRAVRNPSHGPCPA